MSGAWLVWVVGWLIRLRVTKRDIRRAIAVVRQAEPVAAHHLPAKDETTLRVAAVQMELRLEHSVQSFVDHVHQLVIDAVRQGSELIVFPEDTPTGLIGLIPGVRRLVGTANAVGEQGNAAPGNVESGNAAPGNAQSGSRLKTTKFEDDPVDPMSSMTTTSHLDTNALPVADIFRVLTGPVHRLYMECFSALAEKYGVYIVAGSGMFALDGKKVTNTAHVFGPNGLVGTQDKLHFIPMEKEWGLVEGQELSTINLPKARIAVPVCMDATYYETFRIAANKGALLTIIPTANPEEYNFWRSLRGIQTRMDENAMYGINSCMVGSLLGLPLTGRSAVFAPYDLTPRGDGILAEATDVTTEQVVVTTLDFAELTAYKRHHDDLHEPNTRLYEKYYQRLYGGGFV